MSTEYAIIFIFSEDFHDFKVAGFIFSSIIQIKIEFPCCYIHLVTVPKYLEGNKFVRLHRKGQKGGKRTYRPLIPQNTLQLFLTSSITGDMGQ
jgi:hypothetical protein